jgi:hypothetical protein
MLHTSSVLATLTSGLANAVFAQEPFGCADKPAKTRCWLICCEKKIMLWLKKQAEKDGL